LTSDDKNLVDRFRAGDDAAFDQLYRTNQGEKPAEVID
jgi:hypothetical protein